MKTKINRFLITLLASTILAVSAAGCKHTAHGAGQDIENMGEKIKEKTN